MAHQRRKVTEREEQDLVTGMIGDSYNWLLIIIVAFYAGELVWREREQRVAAVVDAFPLPDWIPLAAKFGALLAEARTSAAHSVVSAGLFRWTHAGGWTKVEDPRLPAGAQMLNATRSGEILLRQYDTDPTRVLLGRVSLE